MRLIIFTEFNPFFDDDSIEDEYIENKLMFFLALLPLNRLSSLKAFSQARFFALKGSPEQRLALS